MKRQHQVTGVAAAIGAVLGVVLYRATRSDSKAAASLASTQPQRGTQRENTPVSTALKSCGKAVLPSLATPSTQPEAAATSSARSVAERRSSGWLGWLMLGLSVGGSLLYFLDQQQGEARRLRARGLMGSGWRAAQEQLYERFQELQTCIARRDEEHGAPSEGQSWMPDRLLRDQIRQALTGVMEDPRSVNVRVRRGLVKLTGRVPVSRLDEVLQCVSSMPGVVEVENQLEEVSG